MKNLFKNFVVLAIVLCAACEVVDGPYIEGKKPTDTTSVKSVRKVLLEEYTGHLCINCPTAAKLAHDLKNSYGIQMTIIAIHSGYNATKLGTNYATDFTTSVGNELNPFFNIGDEAPNGVINRKKFNSSYKQTKENWGTCIAEIIAKPQEANIRATKTYNDVSKEISINADIEIIVDINDPMKIAAYITEDNVVDYQKNNNVELGTTPDIPDYKHQHILRGSLNGTWGDELTTNSTVAGTKLNKKINGALNEKVLDPKNANIVLILSNATTSEVIQVEEIKLK